MASLPEATGRIRRDLQGLRGIAVVAVFLYHSGLNGFQGGFVGVDVFLVLSGYLLARQLTDGGKVSFSAFSDFLQKRFRRIAPSLLILSSVTLGVVILLGDARHIKYTMQAIVSIVLFGSNFFFWLRDDYFDLGSEVNPLIHIWSVSLEFQFYVVLALLYLWFGRVSSRSRYVRFSIAFLTVASLVFMLALGQSSSSAAFFLPPGRFWQFGAGALVGISRGPGVVGERVQSAVSFIGLATVVFAIAVFDSSNAAPSPWSVVPVAGACLVLWSSSGGGLSQKILTGRFLVFIGTISYSLYLLHQPILVLWKSTVGPISLGESLLIGSGLVLLSYLGWRNVENPCRDRRVTPDKFFWPGAAILSTGLLIAGLVGHFTPVERIAQLSGVNVGYQDDLESRKLEAISYVEEKIEHEGTRFGQGQNLPKVLFLGDSISRDLMVASTRYGPSSARMDVAHFAFDDLCFDRRETENGCPDGRARLKSSPVVAQADLIVLGFGFSSQTAQSFDDFLDEFQIFRGRTVVVTSAHFVHPTEINIDPEIDSKRSYYLAGIELSRNRAPDFVMGNSLVKGISESYGISFVDGYDLACTEEDFCPLMSPGGSLYFFDEAHRTISGLDFLGGRLYSHLEELLPRNG